MAKPQKLANALLVVVEAPAERPLDTDIYTLTVLQGGERHEFRVFHHTPDDGLIAFIMCEDCHSKTCDHAQAVVKHLQQGAV